MGEAMTCYERDETLCEDQMCLRVGCRIRNDRLSAESKMPARIWAGNPHFWLKPYAAPDGVRELYVAYIRADLVEPLVEALQAIDAMNPHDHGKQGLWTAQKIIRAALSSWEAAQ